MVLNIGYISNETNTDVCMYTCWIYSSRCGYIAVHLENEILNGIYTGLYTITGIDMRRSLMSLKTISVALRLTPVSVNWYLYWFWSSEAAGEKSECDAGN